MDKHLIKFSHCEKQIFCFYLPEACPICDATLSGRRLEEAPVSVPSPFTNGHKTTCCFLITPGPGSSDFDETSELHTGISDTKGVVYNYTMSGVRRDVSGWERSISVPLVRPDMFNLLDQWNQYLEKFSEGPMWDPAWHRFDEKEHNCYSFTLEFVNGVLAMQGKVALSKDHFTEKFILPRMKRASKYNMLTQQINSHSYYVLDRTAEDEAAQKR